MRSVRVPLVALATLSAMRAAAAQDLDPPANLQVTQVTANRLDLSWVDESDAEDGFRIERAPDVAGAPGAFQVVGITQSNSWGYLDGGLPAAGTYWYRVSAFDGPLSGDPSTTVAAEACVGGVWWNQDTGSISHAGLGLLEPGVINVYGTTMNAGAEVLPSGCKRLRGTISIPVLLIDWEDFDPALDLSNENNPLSTLPGYVPSEAGELQSYLESSVAPYFAGATGQELDLQFDVIGWIRSGDPGTYLKPRSDYVYFSQGEYRCRRGDVFLDAVRDAVVQFGTDFADYDADGNGYVDGAVLVYEGHGGICCGGNLSWVNSGYFPGNPPSINWLGMDELVPPSDPNHAAFAAQDVWIHLYNNVPERGGQPDPATTFCIPGTWAHELGHLLFGFPDYYYSQFKLETWGLSAGHWAVPTQPAAFERWLYTRAYEPEPIVATGTYLVAANEIPDQSPYFGHGPEPYLYRIPAGSDPRRFITIESRWWDDAGNTSAQWADAHSRESGLLIVEHDQSVDWFSTTPVQLFRTVPDRTTPTAANRAWVPGDSYYKCFGADCVSIRPVSPAGALSTFDVHLGPPDTQPPATAITYPSDGADASEVVEIQASATDDWAVTRVELYQGTTLLESLTAAPYSASWDATSLPEGSYELSSKAFDVAGNTTTSAPVTVIRDLPPTLAIVSPAEGATIRGTVAATGTASDGFGLYSLQMRVDGGPWDLTFDLESWSFELDTLLLADGAHLVEVQATDSAGHLAIDDVTVVVDNTPPGVSIASPADGATVSGGAFITGTASDGVALAAVHVQIDAGPWLAASGLASWSLYVDTTTLSQGTHAIVARATDSAGNAVTTSGSVVVDNTAPSVAIASPSAGAAVGATVTVSGTAMDVLGLSAVHVRVDWGPWVLASGLEAWSVVLNPPVQGTQTIAARATDGGGNVATTSISVTVDHVAPAVAITSPAAGATVAGDVTLSGTAADAVALGAVDVRVDAGPWIPATGLASWSHVLDSTSLSQGAHTLTARATDSAGNVTTTSSRTVTVDNEAPSISIATPADGATVMGVVTISGSASDGVALSAVHVRVDADPWVPVIGLESWGKNIQTTGLLQGAHTITARATDGAGNVATASRTLTVDNVAPSVSITSPAAGAVLTGTVGVTGTAADGIGLSAVHVRVDSGAWVLASGLGTWSHALDTTTLSLGAHTLSARATDGAGATTTTSFAVTVDNAPPAISGVGATAVGTTSATIVWTTGEASDSQVDYGPTSGYGSQTTLAPALVTSHSQPISGLSPDSVYHYRVRSRDAAGNLALSGDFTFATATANLVANPSFELGSGLDASSWTEGTNHIRATDAHHSGSWALRSTYTGSPVTSTRSDPIAVVPGTTYVVTVWIYNTSTKGSVYLDMNDISGELTLTSSVTNQWQMLQGSWNSGSRTSVTLRCVTGGKNNGSVWFDDVQLSVP